MSAWPEFRVPHVRIHKGITGAEALSREGVDPTLQREEEYVVQAAAAVMLMMGAGW